MKRKIRKWHYSFFVLLSVVFTLSFAGCQEATPASGSPDSLTTGSDYENGNESNQNVNAVQGFENNLGASSTYGYNSSGEIPATAVGGNMNIHFLDVGQGESIFIDYGDYEVLIDAGNNGNGEQVVREMRPYVDGNLELVIGTHPDSDHIGGLDAVIQAYQVDSIIDSGSGKDTVTYKEYINAAKSEPNSSFMEDDTFTTNLGGGAVLRIIETGDGFEDVNDNSVISQLEYGKVKVLFTGDMGEQAELDNLNQFTDINVLKAGHHGSNKSSSNPFLKKVKPEYVIISAGFDNSYGHPGQYALQRFFDHNAVVYGTFLSGRIVMSTDGNTYSFNTNEKLTIDDAGAKAAGRKNTSGQSVDFPKAAEPKPYKKTENINGSLEQEELSYIGNKNGKKFHRTECNSVTTMNESNKVIFDSREEAISAGYTGCKNCNP